jgi:hypothetical protein
MQPRIIQVCQHLDEYLRVLHFALIAARRMLLTKAFLTLLRRIIFVVLRPVSIIILAPLEILISRKRYR